MSTSQGRALRQRGAKVLLLNCDLISSGADASLCFEHDLKCRIFEAGNGVCVRQALERIRLGADAFNTYHCNNLQDCVRCPECKIVVSTTVSLQLPIHDDVLIKQEQVDSSIAVDDVARKLASIVDTFRVILYSKTACAAHFRTVHFVIICFYFIIN